MKSSTFSRISALTVRQGAVSLALLALLAGNIQDAVAGVFSVTPVRIYMTPKDRAVALTVTNEGNTPIVLQADINAWSQDSNGTDKLVLTEDLVMSPPILKLAPKARQVVRLALLQPADPARQLTYRLVMREIPEALAPQTGIDVPVALALSMPVFVTPPVAKRDIVCELATAAEGEIACRNSGTAYAQIRDILVKRGERTLGKFSGGTYVLPGARRTLKLEKTPDWSAGPVDVLVSFDDNKTEPFKVILP